MSYQIDQLLKISKYNIYSNPDIGDEEIKIIAAIISEDKKIVEPYLKKYLRQAYIEDDEMWIFLSQNFGRKIQIDIFDS